MKWYITAGITLGIPAFFLGWFLCGKVIEHRVDQGFICATDGREWKLTGMQTLGITGEYVAVYKRVGK